MNRRQLCLALAPWVVGAALPGCGFRLRGSYDYVFNALFVDMASAPQVGAVLVRSLKQENKLTIYTEPQDRPKAKLVLVLTGEQFDRVITVTNASGQVRELQIRLRVNFSLLDNEGNELIAKTSVAQQRNISYNETQALGKASEEALLTQDLLSDVAQQLQRRLAAYRQKV